MVKLAPACARRKPIPSRFRAPLFAVLMSCSTAFIVSGVITYLRSDSPSAWVGPWLIAFLTAWPIVFLAILTIAPAINKLLDVVVKEQ